MVLQMYYLFQNIFNIKSKVESFDTTEVPETDC